MLKMLKNYSIKIFEVIKSLLILFFVSTLCGLSAYLFNASFWAAFALASALQIIVGYVVTAYIYADYKKNIYESELNKLEKLSTLINCSYCNHQNIITFLPEEVPDFTCESCNQVNSVKLHFTVSRTATPAPTFTDFNKIITEPQTTHNIKL